MERAAPGDGDPDVGSDRQELGRAGHRQSRGRRARAASARPGAARHTVARILCLLQLPGGLGCEGALPCAALFELAPCGRHLTSDCSPDCRCECTTLADEGLVQITCEQLARVPTLCPAAAEYESRAVDVRISLAVGCLVVLGVLLGFLCGFLVGVVARQPTASLASFVGRPRASSLGTATESCSRTGPVTPSLRRALGSMDARSCLTSRTTAPA